MGANLIDFDVKFGQFCQKYDFAGKRNRKLVKVSINKGHKI